MRNRLRVFPERPAVEIQVGLIATVDDEYTVSVTRGLPMSIEPLLLQAPTAQVRNFIPFEQKRRNGLA